MGYDWTFIAIMVVIFVFPFGVVIGGTYFSAEVNNQMFDYAPKTQYMVLNSVPFVFEDQHIVHIKIPEGFWGRITVVNTRTSASLFSVSISQQQIMQKELVPKDYYVDVLTGSDDLTCIEVENKETYRSKIYGFVGENFRTTRSIFDFKPVTLMVGENDEQRCVSVSPENPC